MFGYAGMRMCGVPTVFAPVTTSASLVGTSGYYERSPATAAQGDWSSSGHLNSPQLDSDAIEQMGELQCLALGNSAIGDTGLLRLPFARWCPASSSSTLLPLLFTVDLSFCQLSAAPAVISVLRNVLMNPVAAPRLTTIFLIGNFRDEYGGSRSYCIGNEDQSGKDDDSQSWSHPAEGLVTQLTESWTGHPSLVTLALDPWLVAHHVFYQSVKREKIGVKRLQATQKMQQQPDLSDTVSVTSRRRQSVFEPRKINIFDELVAAAEGSQVEVRPTDTVAEIQYKMVQLQLNEHRGRERLARAEVVDRRALAKETSQFVQATIVAASRAVRNKQQRIIAMEELECEMRQMLVQKESDGRRKLLFRIGSLI